MGQDENKKLEDTEKKARLIVNERLDFLLCDIQDVISSKGNPRNEKVDIDLDEAYVLHSNGLSVSLKRCVKY